MKNNGKNPAMTDSVMSESPLLGRGRGEASGCGPRPIKNREAFFGLLKFGLQRYFDRYDKTYSGVISLTIGVSKGKVLGIAKNERLFTN